MEQKGKGIQQGGNWISSSMMIHLMEKGTSEWLRMKAFLFCCAPFIHNNFIAISFVRSFILIHRRRCSSFFSTDPIHKTSRMAWSGRPPRHCCFERGSAGTIDFQLDKFENTYYYYYYYYVNFTSSPGFCRFCPPGGRASCAPFAGRRTSIRSAGSYCRPISSAHPTTPETSRRNGKKVTDKRRRTTGKGQKRSEFSRQYFQPFSTCTQIYICI